MHSYYSNPEAPWRSSRSETIRARKDAAAAGLGIILTSGGGIAIPNTEFSDGTRVAALAFVGAGLYGLGLAVRNIIHDSRMERTPVNNFPELSDGDDGGGGDEPPEPHTPDDPGGLQLEIEASQLIAQSESYLMGVRDTETARLHKSAEPTTIDS